MTNIKSFNDSEMQRVHLANRLREAREYIGLAQEDVALALGVSRPIISNIETGIRKVESLELATLARLYGASIDYLLTGQESIINEDEKLRFLARTTKDLSEKDLKELSKFADFLRNSSKHPGEK